MYQRGKNVLSVIAMLLLMPLVVTTARYFLEVVFPYDLLVGTAVFLFVMSWFVARAERKQSPAMAIVAIVALFGGWISLGFEGSLLYSSQAWLISAFIWLLLSFWVSIGTLIGKGEPEPVTQ